MLSNIDLKIYKGFIACKKFLPVNRGLNPIAWLKIYEMGRVW